LSKRPKTTTSNTFDAWQLSDLLENGSLAKFLEKDVGEQLEAVLHAKLSIQAKQLALSAILEQHAERKRKTAAVATAYPALPRQRKANGLRKKAADPTEKIAERMQAKMKKPEHGTAPKPPTSESPAALLLEMAAHLNLEKNTPKRSPLDSQQSLSRQKNSLELFRERIAERAKAEAEQQAATPENQNGEG